MYQTVSYGPKTKNGFWIHETLYPNVPYGGPWRGVLKIETIFFVFGRKKRQKTQKKTVLSVFSQFSSTKTENTEGHGF